MILLVDSLVIAQDTIAAANPLFNDNVFIDSLAKAKPTITGLIGATRSEPSWTDVVQACAAVFGSIVALAAGILALLSYKSTVKQQQDQINDQQKELDSLSKIAEGLTNQMNINIERRRFEIRPNLKLFSHNYRWPHFGIVIENTGSTAMDIAILPPPDPYDNYLDEIDYSVADGSTVIYHQQRRTIEVTQRGANALEVHNGFSFYIYYTDIDGNEYVQLITGVNGQVQCQIPLYLGHVTEWGSLKSERAKKYLNVYNEVYSIPMTSEAGL